MPIPNAIVATITSSLPARKSRLHLFAASAVESGVIRLGRESCGSSSVRERARLRGASACRRSRDGGPAPREYLPRAIADSRVLTDACHFDRDVVAPEALNELLRGALSPSWSAMSRCTNGVAVAVKRNHRRRTQAREDAARSCGSPAGNRVPMRDAMRLVDRDQSTACASRASPESLSRAAAPAR